MLEKGKKFRGSDHTQQMKMSRRPEITLRSHPKCVKESSADVQNAFCLNSQILDFGILPTKIDCFKRKIFTIFLH